MAVAREAWSCGPRKSRAARANRVRKQLSNARFVHEKPSRSNNARDLVQCIRGARNMVAPAEIDHNVERAGREGQRAHIPADKSGECPGGADL